MARIFHEDDGDLKVLTGKTVSVIGYGNQGSAQAQNLRDSGIAVVVGNARDAYFDNAVRDGFPTFEIVEAVKRADYHLLLLTDEVMPQVFDRDIAPHLKPNQAVVVSSGYNVYYDSLRCPMTVDVLMIAPRTIGTAVRKTFLSGKGFPSLVGVERDASGRAREVMLAISRAIGTLRCGALESSCEEETLCDLFNEQSGGLYAWRRAVEVLVEGGVSPEAAMLEFWASGEMSDVAEVIQSHGLFGQITFHSRTSQYGQQVTARHSPKDEAAERRRLRGILSRIKDGTFAKEWTREQQAGYPTLTRVHEENMIHPLSIAEEKLLRDLGFWKEK